MENSAVHPVGKSGFGNLDAHARRLPRVRKQQPCSARGSSPHSSDFGSGSAATFSAIPATSRLELRLPAEVLQLGDARGDLASGFVRTGGRTSIAFVLLHDTATAPAAPPSSRTRCSRKPARDSRGLLAGGLEAARQLHDDLVAGLAVGVVRASGDEDLVAQPRLSGLSAGARASVSLMSMAIGTRPGQAPPRPPLLTHPKSAHGRATTTNASCSCGCGAWWRCGVVAGYIDPLVEEHREAQRFRDGG